MRRYVFTQQRLSQKRSSSVAVCYVVLRSQNLFVLFERKEKSQLNNLRRGNAQSQKESKSNYQLHELWGTFKGHHCLQSANSPHGRCCKTKTPVSSTKTVQEKRKTVGGKGPERCISWTMRGPQTLLSRREERPRDREMEHCLGACQCLRSSITFFFSCDRCSADIFPPKQLYY